MSFSGCFCKRHDRLRCNNGNDARDWHMSTGTGGNRVQGWGRRGWQQTSQALTPLTLGRKLTLRGVVLRVPELTLMSLHLSLEYLPAGHAECEYFRPDWITFPVPAPGLGTAQAFRLKAERTRHEEAQLETLSWMQAAGG